MKIWTTGIPELLRGLDLKDLKKVRKPVQWFFREASKVVQGKLRTNVPTRTGKTAKGVRYRVFTGRKGLWGAVIFFLGGMKRFGAGAERVARWMEHGTKASEIGPGSAQRRHARANPTYMADFTRGAGRFGKQKGVFAITRQNAEKNAAGAYKKAISWGRGPGETVAVARHPGVKARPFAGRSVTQSQGPVQRLLDRLGDEIAKVLGK